jgi:hypothetical protein
MLYESLGMSMMFVVLLSYREEWCVLWSWWRGWNYKRGFRTSSGFWILNVMSSIFWCGLIIILGKMPQMHYLFQFVSIYFVVLGTTNIRYPFKWVISEWWWKWWKALEDWCG